jgi:hypothetical protein
MVPDAVGTADEDEVIPWLMMRCCEQRRQIQRMLRVVEASSAQPRWQRGYMCAEKA